MSDDVTDTQKKILDDFEKAKAECKIIIDDSSVAFAYFCKGWAAGYKLGSKDASEMALSVVENALRKVL